MIMKAVVSDYRLLVCYAV